MVTGGGGGSEFEHMTRIYLTALGCDQSQLIFKHRDLPGDLRNLYEAITIGNFWHRRSEQHVAEHFVFTAESKKNLHMLVTLKKKKISVNILAKGLTAATFLGNGDVALYYGAPFMEGKHYRHTENPFTSTKMETPWIMIDDSLHPCAYCALPQGKPLKGMPDSPQSLSTYTHADGKSGG